MRDREGLELLAPDWAALEACARGATLFQSLGWARAVFRFEEARGNGGFAPLIAVLRRRGRVEAILPLERVRARLRRALVPLGNSFGQYSDILARPDTDLGSGPEAALRAALAAARADVVLFFKVREDTRLRAALPPGSVIVGDAEAAPQVALADFPDFAAYHQTIKAKTRKNMRNARNRLEREGALVHVVAATPEETLAVIARTLEGRAGRLKDQGLTSRAFADGAFSRFCTSLVVEEQGLELMAMSLCHDGRPLAEQWGFVHNGRYYAYVASRDFGQTEESPGKLHLKEVIETCFARGLDAADFLVPAMPYKMTWASSAMPVADYALPVTARGWIGVRVWDRRLRPLGKALVLRMPKRLRAGVMRSLGRNL